MKIDVYIGVMGSGKDFLAQEKIDNGAIRVSFADELREDVWKMIKWKPESHEDYERFKASCFIHNPLGIEFTGRDLLQIYGTEIRRMENPNIWCIRAAGNILSKKADGVKNIVVTDCRFNNEIKTLIELSELSDIEVEFHFCNYQSEKYTLDSTHESEKLSIELVHRFNAKEFTESDFNKYIFGFDCGEGNILDVCNY